jgi:hypothetical protein
MTKHLLLSLVLIFQISFLNSQNRELPWLSTIDEKNQRNDIHQIYSEASVEISDSSQYQTRSYYWDP